MNSARLQVRDHDVLRVANRLTDRDRQILKLLSQHRVFTTEQLTEVFFSNATTARHRLTQLHRLRLVDRFKPRRWLHDCAPYHYILGQVGAMVVAADLDEDPGRNNWRADKAIALGSSQRLEHQIGVNQFFIDLMKEERRRPGKVGLTEWWSEARCAKAMAGIVYPDAYGVWEEAGRRLQFLLEYDRGTESLDRLAAKLEGYRELEAASGVRRWVLFSLRTQRREASVRRALAGSPVPVATMARDAAVGVVGAAWQPVDRDGAPITLIDLVKG